MITIDRSLFDENNIDLNIIKQVLKEHKEYCTIREFQKLEDYYFGNHKILRENREALNNRRAEMNVLKLATDQLSSYFLGNGVTLKSDEDISELNNLFRKANIEKVDIQNSRNTSIYGECNELAFLDEDEDGNVNLYFRSISSRNSFVVYDTCMAHHPIFGIYYYGVKVGQKEYIMFYVITKNWIYEYQCSKSLNNFTLIEQKENILGTITLYEVKNNEENRGDWEQQITLQDSINDMVSDILNSSKLEIDRVIVLTGAIADTEQAKKLRQEQKILTLPVGSTAQFLQFSAGSYSEKLESIKFLYKQIYTLSYVPTLDREDSATVNAASGIAIEMAYQTTELVTKTKELYYSETLKQRNKIATKYLDIIGKVKLDPDAIEFTYSRTKPHNLPELAALVASLENVVSKNTRLSLLPFVKDIDKELEELDFEENERIKREEELYNNTMFVDTSDEENEEAVS